MSKWHKEGHGKVETKHVFIVPEDTQLELRYWVILAWCMNKRHLGLFSPKNELYALCWWIRDAAPLAQSQGTAKARSSLGLNWETRWKFWRFDGFLVQIGQTFLNSFGKDWVFYVFLGWFARSHIFSQWLPSFPFWDPRALWRQMPSRFEPSWFSLLCGTRPENHLLRKLWGAQPWSG